MTKAALSFAAVLAAVLAAGAQAGAEPPAGLAPRPALLALQVEPSPGPPPAAPAATPVPIYKAALLSAILPGLGEAYSGHTNRAVISGSAEAAIWISYATFQVQENLRGDRAREFAVHYAGALPNGDEDYYKAIGQYLRAEGPGQWNEYVRRVERDNPGENVGQEYTGNAAWAWTSESSFDRYRDLRRDMLAAEDHGKNALAFALVNRIVSVVSVVQAVRADHQRAAGLGLRFESSPTPRDPWARVGLWNRF